MVSWDPISELARFQRDFSSLFTGPSGTVHQFPAVNVWVNENDAYLTAELPGVEPKDVEVSVEGETVTLSGRRAPVDDAENIEFHRRERLHGNFSRTLQLPFHVDANGVDAKLNRGVLTVKLPRAEEDKPKKIAVKAA